MHLRDLESWLPGHSLRSGRAPFRRRPLFEALEQRLLLSTNVVGSIDAPGETDQYSFTLAADKQVYFDGLANTTIR